MATETNDQSVNYTLLPLPVCSLSSAESILKIIYYRAMFKSQKLYYYYTAKKK